MNTQPPSAEDPLETLLRRSTAPIVDAGFSARVLATLPLPAPKPRLRPNRRFIACSLGATTGLIWALAQSGPQRTGDLAAFISEFETSFTSIVNSLSDPPVLILGTLILASLAFAFFREIIAKFD